RTAVPGDRPVSRYREIDHHRLDDRRRLIARHVEFHRMGLHRNGDDEHDEQHQHDVDQRRRVDVHHYLVLAPRLAQIDRHRPYSAAGAVEPRWGWVMKAILDIPARWQSTMTRPTNS